MIYGCVVGLPHRVAKNVKLIESVQNRFARRILLFHNSHMSFAQRLAFLDLECLEMRVLKIALCHLYKVVCGLCDVDISLFCITLTTPHLVACRMMLRDAELIGAGFSFPFV